MPNRQWNFLLVHELVPLDIAHIICSLFIPANEQEDKLVWGLAGGVYSVRSGTLWAQGLVPSPPKVVNFSWIWKLNTAPKIKNFLRKACNYSIPTKDRLQKSHVFLLEQCVFCNNHCETTSHLVFLCPFTLDFFQHLLASFGWAC